MAIRARPRTGAANPNPNVSELSASRASVVVTPAWDGWPDAKTTAAPRPRHPMNGITGSAVPAGRNPYRARPVSTVAATGRRGADQPAPTRPSRAMAATATARAPSSTGVRAGTGTDRDTRWTRLNRAPAASVTPAGARSGRPAMIARSRQVRGAAPAGSTGGDRARLAANATDRAARTSRVSER